MTTQRCKDSCQSKRRTTTERIKIPLQNLQESGTVHKDIIQHFYANQKANATKSNITRKQLAELDTECKSVSLPDCGSKIKEQL